MFSAIVMMPMLEEQLRMNFCVCMIIQILRNYECNQWQSWIPWWFSWTNFSLGYSCCFVLFLLNCVLVCEHLFLCSKTSINNCFWFRNQKLESESVFRFSTLVKFFQKQEISSNFLYDVANYYLLNLGQIIFFSCCISVKNILKRLFEYGN